MRRPGTIRPIDYHNTEANNPISDYACLKHFFQCKENTAVGDTTVSGVQPWLDSKGNLSIPVSWTQFGGEDSTSHDPAATTDAVITGNLYQPGSQAYMVLAVCGWANVSSKSFTIGSTTGARLCRVYTSVTGCTASDGTNTATAALPGTAITTSDTGAIGIIHTPGDATSLKKFHTKEGQLSFPLSGATKSGAGYDISGNGSSAPGTITSLTAIPQLFSCDVGMRYVYGLAVFGFANGIPADMRQAIAWMSVQWQNGNKVIWPGWKYLA